VAVTTELPETKLQVPPHGALLTEVGVRVVNPPTLMVNTTVDSACGTPVSMRRQVTCEVPLDEALKESVATVCTIVRLGCTENIDGDEAVHTEVTD